MRGRNGNDNVGFRDGDYIIISKNIRCILILGVGFYGFFIGNF